MFRKKRSVVSLEEMFVNNGLNSKSPIAQGLLDLLCVLNYSSGECLRIESTRNPHPVSEYGRLWDIRKDCPLIEWVFSEFDLKWELYTYQDRLDSGSYIGYIDYGGKLYLGQ